MPQSHPSFLTCRRCNLVQWFTQECIDRYGKRVTRCRRCRGNDWRQANVYPTFGERVYLLRWFIWQMWHTNRKGDERPFLRALLFTTKGADRFWYYKPWLLWKTIHYGLFRLMRDYNRIEPEGDNECPRNIAALRAELSGNGAHADPRLHDAVGLVRGARGNPV